uniref:Uncharacterized protein LOC105113419 isoform X1 n=1 Tax=Rhizophora mucronata TaxID=61149 RepID=A0A2P2JSR2_RHIMU
MEMADNPKLKMACSSEAGELVESIESQKISVFGHVNGLQYKADKSDGFVIDMESFSHGSNKDMNANSRIALQRNLSRKGSQRGVESKKINNPNTSTNDREITVATSSPRGNNLAIQTLMFCFVSVMGR